MKIPQLVNTLRLVLGAIEAEAAGSAIADEFKPSIVGARAEIETMRGPEVLSAVLECRRAGLSLALDVRARGQTVKGKKQRERQPGQHK